VEVVFDRSFDSAYGLAQDDGCGVTGAVAEEYAIGLSCEYVFGGGVCGHDVYFAAVGAEQAEDVLLDAEIEGNDFVLATGREAVRAKDRCETVARQTELVLSAPVGDSRQGRYPMSRRTADSGLSGQADCSGFRGGMWRLFLLAFGFCLGLGLCFLSRPAAACLTHFMSFHIRYSVSNNGRS